MKIASKSLMCVLLSLTFIVESPIALASSKSSAASSSSLSMVIADKADFLKKEVKRFKKNVDSGRMSVDRAVATFTDALISADVGVADLDAFVAKSASAKSYKQFKAVIAKSESAMSGLSSIPSDLLGEIAGSALESVNPEGLAWSGCSGLTAGVVVLIAAAVVGIIALSKSRGVESLRALYVGKRSSRQNLLVSNINWIKNRAVSIERDITSNEGKITDAELQIVYLTGQLVSEDDAVKRQAMGDQIAAYTTQISDLTTANEQLRDEQRLYSDPAYVSRRIADENADYAIDIDQLNREEAVRIALVPSNQALAKKLGIAAGIAGAIGAYFTIDGAMECR